MEKKSIDFAAIPQTALKVLTSPVSFFREMAKTGGFVEPLVFLVAHAVVTAIVDGVLFVNSGYSHHGCILPGNVLLAFSAE